MQRYIIISLKTANSFGKTQQLIPLPLSSAICRPDKSQSRTRACHQSLAG